MSQPYHSDHKKQAFDSIHTYHGIIIYVCITSYKQILWHHYGFTCQLMPIFILINFYSRKSQCDGMSQPYHFDHKKQPFSS